MRWDVWAGGILWLEVKVSVTGKAWKGGELHSGTRNILERLENRWVETKRKLDHLGEGLHKAASQKHKGTCGSQYQRPPQTPQLCDRTEGTFRHLSPKLPHRLLSDCLTLEADRLTCNFTILLIVLSMPRAPTACAAWHLPLGQAPLTQRGCGSKITAALPQVAWVRAEQEQHVHFHTGCTSQRESLCTNQQGGQQGILKGPGFHCAWEGGWGGCYKHGS